MKAAKVFPNVMSNKLWAITYVIKYSECFHFEIF